MGVENRAIKRLGWWMLLLAGVGAIAAAWWGGWRWSAGFLLGAVASYWNFRALKKIVDHLAFTAGAAPRPRGGGIFRVVLRFVLLAIGAFAILKFSELSVIAALTGLFVSAAAVILEIVFELVSAK